MSSTRSFRCLRGRTLAGVFILICFLGLYSLYMSQEKSVELVNQHSRCLSEQAEITQRLRDETAAKETAMEQLNEKNDKLVQLTHVFMKEKIALKDEIGSLETEIKTLRYESNKFKEQIQEEHKELEQHKLSLLESQRQLNNELMTKNLIIDVLKEDKKELSEMLKKLQGNNRFPFNYPLPKVNLKYFRRLVDLGNSEFKVMAGDEQTHNSQAFADVNLKKLVGISLSKGSAMNITEKHKLDGSMSLNGSINAEAIRPVVPNGFAPELIVNEDKHKSGDYVNVIAKKSAGVGLRNDVDMKPPSRYKAKIDKIEDVKVEDAQIKKNDKQDVFQFHESPHRVVEDPGSHEDIREINPNDVNAGVDQGELGLPAEEDDDDYDGFEKALFHQAGNLN